MPTTPRPSTWATASAGWSSAPVSTAAGPEKAMGRPRAAPALELDVSTDSVLPMVDSRVVPSLVMVVTTGTVVTDRDVEPDDDDDDDDVLVVVAVLEPEAMEEELVLVLVVEPMVVTRVVPSLVMVETTGAVVVVTADAVLTTEEKMPMAAKVVPVAVAWAGGEETGKCQLSV